jgi:hypothetical protein
MKNPTVVEKLLGMLESGFLNARFTIASSVSAL